MNLEQRISFLEEQVGITEDKVVISKKRKNIKMAHQYTIRNYFVYNDPKVINYAYQELEKNGIEEGRIKALGGLALNFVNLSWATCRVNFESSIRGYKTEIEMGFVSFYFSNKDYLAWENALFDELEIESDKTGIPYSGKAAKEFLLKRAKETIQDLRLKPKSFGLYKDAVKYFEEYEDEVGKTEKRASQGASSEEIDSIVKGKWSKNSKGEIDVEGDVEIPTGFVKNSILKEIGQFGRVTGKFQILRCGIKSLEGSPKECDIFEISNVKLLNLRFMPKKINKQFKLSYNVYLDSFKGMPQVLNCDLVSYQSKENVGSLDGFSKVINGDLNFPYWGMARNGNVNIRALKGILDICDVKGQVKQDYFYKD